MNNSDKKTKRERSRSREKSPIAPDTEAKKREERRKKFGPADGNNIRNR